MEKTEGIGVPADTVIILGAGFSFDAGIPLMSGFVDKMWDLANRRSLNGNVLSGADVQIFDNAMKVRNDLNEYHGRAAFDDRNIEDLLSILSFNSYLPQSGRTNRLAAMTKAIARTIELCCEVKHPGIEKPGYRRIVNDGPGLYRDFWRALFKLPNLRTRMPALITFNYDLVLERAFFQTLIGTNYDRSNRHLPFSKVRLKHHYAPIPEITYGVAYTTYRSLKFNEHEEGTTLNVVDGGGNDAALEIDILKLHGSLNFPSPRSNFDPRFFQVTESLQEPFILPPIFNKQSSGKQQDIWRRALTQLRSAKNVVIVGYSLPKTDIYMQYFLKAALGPNVNLNRIFVFDPALHGNGRAAEEMEARYADCFSPQLRNRIAFRPIKNEYKKYPAGTAAHFIDMLDTKPDDLIF